MLQGLMDKVDMLQMDKVLAKPAPVTGSKPDEIKITEIIYE